MKKEIIITADGSNTVAIPEMNVTYHSHHGAIQESVHVFIEAGLRYISGRLERRDTLRIFEMGFGTGLNAFLTAIEVKKTKTNIHYTAVETAPLSLQEAGKLNYTQVLSYEELFQQLHQCNWNAEVQLSDCFSITKLHTDLAAFQSFHLYHLIFYDAFAPSAQPELWTQEVFEKLFAMLEPNGVLVTYCSKSDVRRAMQAAGFMVEKLPGPKGKREMVRATQKSERSA